MPLQSSQFKIIKVADELGALTEISADVRTASHPKGNVAANARAFAAGGGIVTNSQFKGAVTSQLSVEVFHGNAIVALLMRIWNKRDGGLWQFWEGNNAAPTFGDQMFQGSFTLFGMNLAYATNQEAVWTLDLRPSDGGLVVPGWYPV